MIVFLLGMMLTMTVTAGGYLAAEQNPFGVLLIFIGSIGLGLLVSHLQHHSVCSGVEFDNGLTVGTLRKGFSDDMMDEMQVYIANPDIAPACGLFTARIDGKRVLVIEKGSHSGETV